MVNSRIPNGPWKRWKKSRSRDGNFATREVQARPACRRLRRPAYDGEAFKFLKIDRARALTTSHRELVELCQFKRVQAALFFLQLFRSDFLEIRFSGNKTLFRFISEYFLSSRVTIPDLLASDAFEQHLFVREVWVPGWLGGTG